jgi:hypothetical protein
MMTEHEAFQEARRIVSETDQPLFVLYQPSQPLPGSGKKSLAHYDVGIVVPLMGFKSVIGYAIRPGNPNSWVTASHHCN